MSDKINQLTKKIQDKKKKLNIITGLEKEKLELQIKLDEIQLKIENQKK